MPVHDNSEPDRPNRPGHESHYDLAKRALEELTQRLASQGETRLPPEGNLADVTGFSRPTVRSALLAMQKEGKILRKHGVGTFINRHALDIRANLADDRPFLSVIEQLGYEPYLDIVGLTEEPLPDRITDRAGVDDGAKGIVIDRLFRASNEPAVLSRDYIPTRHVAASVGELAAERSTFAFVSRWTDHEVRYSVASIFATEATEETAGLLNLSAGTAVLEMDHLHVDERDEVIGVTEAFVRSDLLRFTVVRTGEEL